MSRWSFKDERRFMEIAASSKSFDEVVDLTRRTPRAVYGGGPSIGFSFGTGRY